MTELLEAGVVSGVGDISPLPDNFCLFVDVGRQSAKKCRHVKSKDDGNDEVTENAHTCYQGKDGNVALPLRIASDPFVQAAHPLCRSIREY